MEHRHQLSRRHRGGVVEERVGEDVEQHHPGAFRQPQRGQQLLGADLVQVRVGLAGVEPQQAEADGVVGAGQLAQPQAGRAEGEGEDAQRRCGGQPVEFLLRPAFRDHRVAAQRVQQRLRPGADSAQDLPPVVVLPEEAVEPVVDPLHGAVGQRARVRAEAAAEKVGGFADDDGEAAFGEDHGGGRPGDAAADHDDPRPARGRARRYRARGVGRGAGQVRAHADQPSHQPGHRHPGAHRCRSVAAMARLRRAVATRGGSSAWSSRAQATSTL